MAKGKKTKPPIDLVELLREPMQIRVGGELKTVSPFEAQFEQTAARALNGDVRSATSFIRWCIAEGLVAKPRAFDECQDLPPVPRDWDETEFFEAYCRFGRPPPWPGRRDGLTETARAALKGAKRAARTWAPTIRSISVLAAAIQIRHQAMAKTLITSMWSATVDRL